MQSDFYLRVASSGSDAQFYPIYLMGMRLKRVTGFQSKLVPQNRNKLAGIMVMIVQLRWNPREVPVLFRSYRDPVLFLALWT